MSQHCCNPISKVKLTAILHFVYAQQHSHYKTASLNYKIRYKNRAVCYITSLKNIKRGLLCKHWLQESLKCLFPT